MDTDHDLLVRIDEQMKQLRTSIDTDRMNAATRAAKQDTELDKLRIDVESLRTSRAQFYAVAATISFAISLLIRLFWK